MDLEKLKFLSPQDKLNLCLSKELQNKAFAKYKVDFCMDELVALYTILFDRNDTFYKVILEYIKKQDDYSLYKNIIF